MECTYVAIRSGYYFGLVPVSQIKEKDIHLIPSSQKVTVNQITYTLNVGLTWADCQKIDGLLDEFGDYEIKKYILNERD